MAEWSNAVDSKSIVRVSVPGVQIPLSPPIKKSRSFMSGIFCGEREFSFGEISLHLTGLWFGHLISRQLIYPSLKRRFLSSLRRLLAEAISRLPFLTASS